jgi:hypothetical protein
MNRSYKNNKMNSQISISLRHNSEGQLRVAVCFLPSQFEGYDLQQTPHVEHFLHDGKHCFRLNSIANARTRKLSAKNVVFFRPSHFGLADANEPLEALRFEADFTETTANGNVIRMIMINYDKEEFIVADRAVKKEIRKIDGTSVDKINKGFAPDSAWGQDIQNLVDSKIAQVIKNSISNQYAVRHQQTLVLPNITYNVPTGIPLLSPIKFGSAK